MAAFRGRLFLSKGCGRYRPEEERAAGSEGEKGKSRRGPALRRCWKPAEATAQGLATRVRVGGREMARVAANIEVKRNLGQPAIRKAVAFRAA